MKRDHSPQTLTPTLRHTCKPTERSLFDASIFSILAKLKGEQSDSLRAQKAVAADICFQLAEYYQQSKAPDKAQAFYNEALRHDEAHEAVRKNAVCCLISLSLSLSLYLCAHFLPPWCLG